MAVLESEPHYCRGWELLTDWKLQKNDWEGALSGAERLIRLNPAAPDGYDVRARIYTQTGRKEEAKIEYQRILALTPGFIPAAWRAFLAQLEDQQLSQAKRTIELLQPHASTAVIVPAKILLATRSQKPEEAFTLLAEAAVLPELDANALKTAIEAMDKVSWHDKINKLLEDALRDPACNPNIAAMWVSRCGKQHSWKLLKQFRKLPPQSRVHTLFLEQWLIESNANGTGSRVPLAITTKCREHAVQDTLLWGRIGNDLVNTRCNTQAAQWLKDWEARSDVQCWMVVNLVLALSALKRQGQADTVSRKILQRGLKDHSAAYLLAYLTLSSLETRAITEAKTYFNDILFEGQSAQTGAYIRHLLQTAFDIQETTGRADRKSRLTEELIKAKLARTSLKFSRALLAMERRAIIQMARDAGYVLPAAVAKSVQGKPQPKGWLLPLIYFIFIISNLLRNKAQRAIRHHGHKIPSPNHHFPKHHSFRRPRQRPDPASGKSPNLQRETRRNHRLPSPRPETRAKQHRRALFAQHF